MLLNCIFWNSSLYVIWITRQSEKGVSSRVWQLRTNPPSRPSSGLGQSSHIYCDHPFYALTFSRSELTSINDPLPGPRLCKWQAVCWADTTIILGNWASEMLSNSPEVGGLVRRGGRMWTHDWSSSSWLRPHDTFWPLFQFQAEARKSSQEIPQSLSFLVAGIKGAKGSVWQGNKVAALPSRWVPE